MSDYALSAEPTLCHLRTVIGDTVLEEVTDLGIVSIAIPLGGDVLLAQSLEEGYGASLPKSGVLSVSRDRTAKFLGMAPDQVMALVANAPGDAVDGIRHRLGDAAYFTSQTDNWVILRLSGDLSRSALERICPVDLNATSFRLDNVARTVMEHLSVIILREGEKGFLLLSPRSSATSFLHAVETSIKNVTGK